MSEPLDSIAVHDSGADQLETFRRERVPMSVTLDGSDGTFTSSLVRLGSDYLHIDQLVPKFGDQLLQPGMALTLRTTYKGIAYWFHSAHLKLAVDGRGHPYHWIARPERVENDDKRSSYRIQARLSDRHLCHVAVPPAAGDTARLEDISEGGACIRLQTPESRLTMGGLVEFNLEFEKLGALTCPAQVRYLQSLEKTGETRVGIAFGSLSPNDMKNLRRILMKLQRRNIRTGLHS